MGRLNSKVWIIFISTLFTAWLYSCSASGQATPSYFNYQTTQAIPSPKHWVTPTLTTITTRMISSLEPSRTPFIDPTRGLHEWIPAPILIQSGLIHSQKRDPFNRDPSFVLYADGTLIKKRCYGIICDYFQAKISQKQICALLNTIEKIGFFDYDPSGYLVPVTGGDITFIEVAAWRYQSIALYQLKDWLEDPTWLERILKCEGCRQAPFISPALSDTYRIIKEYFPAGSEIYHPEYLAIWISEPEFAGDPVNWTSTSISLRQLAEMSLCQDSTQRQVVVLGDKKAEIVANYVNQVVNQGFSPIFSEGDLVVQLTTRWLLPYENAAGCGDATNQFPSVDYPQINESMICRRSDGFISTPTPTFFP